MASYALSLKNNSMAYRDDFNMSLNLN